MVGGEEVEVTSRERLLANVRGALGRTVGQSPSPAAPLAAPYLRFSESQRNRSIELFVQNFEKLAGKASIVKNASGVASKVSELLDGRRAVASNAPYLESCGVTALAQVQSGIRDRETLREACATAGAGITSVDYALAETGTFVLLSSPQEARLISLLPPVHVAVFQQSRIIANLAELLALVPHPAEQTSAMVLITGPSRTADIEQILVRGVHGPGEVYAIIVEE